MFVLDDSDPSSSPGQEGRASENADSMLYTDSVPSSNYTDQLPITAEIDLEQGLPDPHNENFSLNPPSNFTSAWVEPLTGAGFGGSIAAMEPDAMNPELEMFHPGSSSSLLALNPPIGRLTVDFPFNEDRIDLLGAVTTKKRTRKNQHVEVGNNRFGKAGTLRCEACRRRRRKCVYRSLSDACEFCVSQNKASCDKKWGPGKESSMSRPVPGPPEQVLDSDQVLLLQWVYNGEQHTTRWRREETRFLLDAQWEIFGLAKEIIRLYTKSVTSLPLRYALLAYCGVMTSGGLSGNRELQNISHAIVSLREKLARSSFDEGDLFASVLLGIISPGLEAHLNGFIGIMTHLRDNKTYSLRRFWPMARDLLFSFPLENISAVCFCHLYDRSRAVIGPPNLQQRFGYIGQISLGLTLDLHYHDRLLSKAFQMLLQNNGDEMISRTIQTLVDDIHVDMDAVEVWMTSSSPKEELSEARRQEIETGISTEWLSPASFLKYSFCKLTVTILGAHSIIDGVQNDVARVASETLLHLVVLAKTSGINGMMGRPLYESNLCRRAYALAVLTCPTQSLALDFDSIYEVLRELGGPILVEHVYQYLLRPSNDTLLEALSCIFG